MDRSTLVERVNRGHKVNLTFSHVSSDRQKIHRLAGAPPLIHSSFIAPLFADPDRIKHSKLQQFLKEPILSSADWSFSVRDIISICANNKGAVHCDPSPGNDRDARLFRLGSEHRVFDIDMCIACIPDIAWVAVRGLKPLVSAVLADYGISLV